jgi:ABC-2 type transport system permease protein
MKIGKVLNSVLKINILNELQYSKDLYVQLFTVILDITLSLVTIEIMFSGITSIGLWRKEDILVLVGLYRIINGLLNLFILPSLSSLTSSIISGSLDYVLLLPIDAQFISSIREVRIWKLSDVIVGAIFICIIKYTYNISFHILNIIGLIIAIIIGCIIVACFYSIIASLSFWFLDSSYLLIIFPQCLEWAGKWPVSIFPRFFRILFTFIIPIGIAITIPTEVLINKFNIEMIIICFCFSIVMIFVSRIIWRMGIKKYSGASS